MYRTWTVIPIYTEETKRPLLTLPLLLCHSSSLDSTVIGSSVCTALGQSSLSTQKKQRDPFLLSLPSYSPSLTLSLFLSCFYSHRVIRIYRTWTLNPIYTEETKRPLFTLPLLLFHSFSLLLIRQSLGVAHLQHFDSHPYLLHALSFRGRIPPLNARPLLILQSSGHAYLPHFDSHSYLKKKERDPFLLLLVDSLLSGFYSHRVMRIYRTWTVIPI